MSRLCPLFSGSSGNSVYIGHRGEGILIDAGRTAKKIEESLANNDIDIKSIKFIFVTHEHTDHISALRVFASRYKIKVYASEGTMLALEKKGVIDGGFPYEVLGKNGIETLNMQVSSFRTSHDCSEGVGYVVKLSDESKVAVCTDLGFISSEVKDSINGCNVLLIESNYDLEMLRKSHYPEHLKRRILSDKGHLSNKDCSSILPYLVKNGLTRIVLSHLSSENNKPSIALEIAKEALRLEKMIINKDFTLDVSPKVNTGQCKVIF